MKISALNGVPQKQSGAEGDECLQMAIGECKPKVFSLLFNVCCCHCCVCPLFLSFYRFLLCSTCYTLCDQNDDHSSAIHEIKSDIWIRQSLFVWDDCHHQRDGRKTQGRDSDKYGCAKLLRGVRDISRNLRCTSATTHTSGSGEIVAIQCKILISSAAIDCSTGSTGALAGKRVLRRHKLYS